MNEGHWEYCSSSEKDVSGIQEGTQGLHIVVSLLYLLLSCFNSSSSCLPLHIIPASGFNLRWDYRRKSCINNKSALLSTPALLVEEERHGICFTLNWLTNKAILYRYPCRAWRKSLKERKEIEQRWLCSKQQDTDHDLQRWGVKDVGDHVLEVRG